jgi:hypothetical protein
VKTATDLTLLVQQKTWDKDLVLWLGPEKRLREILGSSPIIVLDLLDLFDSDHMPMDDDETRSELQRHLRNWLQAHPTGPDSRTVLLVRSVSLLVRYQVGVRDFYEWFCNDFGMVVLVLNGLLTETIQSEEVICVPERLVQYFRPPEVVKEVYGEVA